MDSPVINTTPYDPSTFYEKTGVAVQLPWHQNPMLFFALSLILFALCLLVFVISRPRI